MTLREKIKSLAPETIVILDSKNACYGAIWMGQAKSVFRAVTWEAWNGTDLEVRVYQDDGRK